MRSYVLKAAIAAAILSSSLSLGYAATPTKPAAMKPETQKLAATQASLNKFPPKPIAYHSPRLSRIVAELNSAAHRIDVDRHRGELTAKEASAVRKEDGQIRQTAMNIAAKHGGKISNASYAMLQGRVTTLNHDIHRYATNSAHA